jgi:hypothetical protein
MNYVLRPHTLIWASFIRALSKETIKLIVRRERDGGGDMLLTIFLLR